MLDVKGEPDNNFMYLQYQQEENYPFVDRLLPHVSSFAFTWFNLQARRRKYHKQHDRRMPLTEELEFKREIQMTDEQTKHRWASRLLAKLRKDIMPERRVDFVRSVEVGPGSAQQNCIQTMPDMKGKMRRIDCLRQADKVWRLDIVMAVLFRGIPLESTDGEKIFKAPECDPTLLCVNPYHLMVQAKEIDMYLSTLLHEYEIPESQVRMQPCNGLKIAGSIFSTSVFTPREFHKHTKYGHSYESQHPCEPQQQLPPHQPQRYSAVYLDGSPPNKRLCPTAVRPHPGERSQTGSPGLTAADQETATITAFQQPVVSSGSYQTTSVLQPKAAPLTVTNVPGPLTTAPATAAVTLVHSESVYTSTHGFKPIHRTSPSDSSASSCEKAFTSISPRDEFSGLPPKCAYKKVRNRSAQSEPRVSPNNEVTVITQHSQAAQPECRLNDFAQIVVSSEEASKGVSSDAFISPASGSNSNHSNSNVPGLSIQQTLNVFNQLRKSPMCVGNSVLFNGLISPGTFSLLPSPQITPRGTPVPHQLAEQMGLRNGNFDWLEQNLRTSAGVLSHEETQRLRHAHMTETMRLGNMKQ